MALSFNFPLTAGQKITADMLNELIFAIQDGSIFTSVSFVSDLVTTLDTRVATLEAEVNVLNAIQGRNFIREQFTLTLGQSIIPLSKTPSLDSELVFLNGSSLAKNNVPVGTTADYYLTGSTLNLVTELALLIQAGDRLVVCYSYEVP